MARDEKQNLITPAEAAALIAGKLAALPGESVALATAAGRVIAADAIAPFPLPRFDNSALDGYGVRASDTRGASREKPVLLKVAGVVAAGASPDFEIDPGQCAQVMTGAPLPRGADAIVMVEQTGGFADDIAAIHAEVAAGNAIRKRGEEIETGATVVARGARIGPGEIGMLATLGIGAVAVARRPRIALLATGDELRAPGEKLGDGEIYNSNQPLLAAAAAYAHAEVVTQAVIRDTPAALENWFRDVAPRVDAIIATGGVSMGRFDHVLPTAERAGFEKVFWRIAQKPGKPLFFAADGGRLFFGLPGNPVSTFFCFMEYVFPALLAMQGAPPPEKLTATLDAPFPREKSLTRFLFGRVSVRDGVLHATPAPKAHSHMTSSTVGANAILSAAPGEGALAAGAPIQARLLPWETL